MMLTFKILKNKKKNILLRLELWVFNYCGEKWSFKPPLVLQAPKKYSRTSWFKWLIAMYLNTLCFKNWCSIVRASFWRPRIATVTKIFGIYIGFPYLFLACFNGLIFVFCVKTLYWQVVQHLESGFLSVLTDVEHKSKYFVYRVSEMLKRWL